MFDLKEVCVLFHAQKIFWQGTAYTVPAAWRALYDTPSNRFKPHVPILTAVKDQELF